MRTASRFLGAALVLAGAAGCGGDRIATVTAGTPSTGATPAGTPSPSPGRPEAVERFTEGTPDLSKGVDPARAQDPAYQEQLSAVTQELRVVRLRIEAALKGDDDLIDFGVMPGARSLVVYWAGPKTSKLARAIRTGRQPGISVVVAPRTVDKAELAAAEKRIQDRMHVYRSKGIHLVAYGGFAADFDGVKVVVDKDRSRLTDVAQIRRLLQTDTGLPVDVTLGGIAF